MLMLKQVGTFLLRQSIREFRGCAHFGLLVKVSKVCFKKQDARLNVFRVALLALRSAGQSERVDASLRSAGQLLHEFKKHKGQEKPALHFRSLLCPCFLTT